MEQVQEGLRADSPLMHMSNSFLGESGLLSLSIPGPRRDSTYYISDGNTVLLVENTLFRVSASSVLGYSYSTYNVHRVLVWRTYVWGI